MLVFPLTTVFFPQSGAKVFLAIDLRETPPLSGIFLSVLAQDFSCVGLSMHIHIRAPSFTQFSEPLPARSFHPHLFVLGSFSITFGGIVSFLFARFL